ncbi:CoA-binding protein [Chitinibacter bivalviorum]|uniref:CoA-binding protein n=1 Tax=Chitinibacter bivalviorum TaxID=2739434 RepID=A0A7H9BHK6_9NEIS|nr:CoA-binding protein [Chitinibacter bivalviorum]QLG87812.1 CoA-binding protein [Chitinibacter bivalviorum]
MSFQNPSDAQIKAILQSCKTIAVVGLSDKTNRASHGVAKLMQQWGFKIIPVTPKPQETILGEKVYPDLASVPGEIDLVNVFRRSEEAGAVVDAAIARGAKAIWLQLDIIDEAAAARAQAAGIPIVMDRCLMVEYGRLFAD